MNIWGRLGISVAIVATFCIIMTEVFQSKSYYEAYKWYICAAFLALGCVVWIVGRFLNARFAVERMRQDAEARRQEEPDDSSHGGPPMLLNFCYWGAMVFLFGIIIIFIVPYSTGEAQPVAARTTEVKKDEPPITEQEPVEVRVQPPRVSRSRPFPPLRLQGIVYRLPNPSVLINGRTYFVGDLIEDAKVVAIQQASATLAWDGQFKVLDLER